MLFPIYTQDFSGGASGKEPPANAGDKRDTGSIPGFKEVEVGKMTLPLFFLGEDKETYYCPSETHLSFHFNVLH